MGKCIGGVNKAPFGPGGIRVGAANNGSIVGGVVYIQKQASDVQFVLGVDDTGTVQIDTITPSGTNSVDGSIVLRLDGAEVTVDVLSAETAVADCTAKITAALVGANFLATDNSTDVTVSHNHVGIDSAIEVVSNTTEFTLAVAISTPGADASTANDVITLSDKFGKQKTLFSLANSGVNLSADNANTTGLSAGEFVIRVWNAAGVLVGYASKFHLNNVIFKSGTVGASVGNDTVTGSYEIANVTYTGSVASIEIPVGSKAEYFVEGRALQKVDS